MHNPVDARNVASTGLIVLSIFHNLANSEYDSKYQRSVSGTESTAMRLG
jgi:hypothetical protein